MRFAGSMGVSRSGVLSNYYLVKTLVRRGCSPSAHHWLGAAPLCPYRDHVHRHCFPGGSPVINIVWGLVFVLVAPVIGGLIAYRPEDLRPHAGHVRPVHLPAVLGRWKTFREGERSREQDADLLCNLLRDLHGHLRERCFFRWRPPARGLRPHPLPDLPRARGLFGEFPLQLHRGGTWLPFRSWLTSRW